MVVGTVPIPIPIPIPIPVAVAVAFAVAVAAVVVVVVVIVVVASRLVVAGIGVGVAVFKVVFISTLVLIRVFTRMMDRLVRSPPSISFRSPNKWMRRRRWQWPLRSQWKASIPFLQHLVYKVAVVCGAQYFPTEGFFVFVLRMERRSGREWR